jgi:hypothetical protein
LFQFCISTRGITQLWLLQVKEEVVENFKNPTIFWRAVGTNFVKIWRFSKNKSSKSNDFGLGHFYFTKKPLNEIWH